MGLFERWLQFHHRCLRQPTLPSTFVNVSPTSPLLQVLRLPQHHIQLDQPSLDCPDMHTLLFPLLFSVHSLQWHGLQKAEVAGPLREEPITDVCCAPPLYFLNKQVSYLFHIIFCPFVYISVDAGGNIRLQFCHIHLKVWSSQALQWLQRTQSWQHGERQRKLKLEKDNGDLNRNNNGACVLQNRRQQPPFSLTNFQKCWISLIIIIT